MGTLERARNVAEPVPQQAAMIVDFSQTATLPAIVRGLAALGIIGMDLWDWAMARGGPNAWPGEKRQAIQPRRPGARWTAAAVNAPLELWWKSSTPARRFMARVGCRDHGPVTICREGAGGTLRVVFGDGVEVDPGEMAALDGFANVEDFRQAFVPIEGDAFEGWLIRW